ncbi:hypothetical protein HY632_01060 [Candidatus Uhrbacteria bacterium]|nr:hypothetical protein [Candidatus Uhrbacteria bacterium]
MPERFSPPTEENPVHPTVGEDAELPESPPELAEFCHFVADELDFLDRDAVEQRPPAEQLALLRGYWNTPASIMHFQELLHTTGDAAAMRASALETDTSSTNDDLRHRFLAYLLHKLPMELRERWENDVDQNFPAAFPRLARAAAQPKRGLLLGFHVSPRAIASDHLWVTASADEFSAIAQVVDAPHATPVDARAKSWYSIDPHHLYGHRARHLYLVEGSRGDIGSPREFQPGHIWSAAPLRVRQRIMLTPDVIRSLDLKFDATTNRQQ